MPAPSPSPAKSDDMTVPLPDLTIAPSAGPSHATGTAQSDVRAATGEFLFKGSSDKRTASGLDAMTLGLIGVVVLGVIWTIRG